MENYCLERSNKWYLFWKKWQILPINMKFMTFFRHSKKKKNEKEKPTKKQQKKSGLVLIDNIMTNFPFKQFQGKCYSMAFNLFNIWLLLKDCSGAMFIIYFLKLKSLRDWNSTPFIDFEISFYAECISIRLSRNR